MGKAETFANQFSVPTFYDNYQQMLDDKNIDVIYLGLPNHLHKEWIIRCANAGKHILCEKPLILSIKEANEVYSAIKHANVFCMEALMYRCHPFTKKILNLFQNKIIGDVTLINALYTANIASIANSTAGGAIRNLGCYPLSLVRLLANSEPTEIVALGRLNGLYKDNLASVILKFPNNMIGVVSTADDLEMYWQFDACGTEGRLQIISNPWLPDQNNNRILIYKNDNPTPIEINVIAEKSLYSYQIDAVNGNINNGNRSEVHDGISWEESVGNIRVLEEWLRQVIPTSIAEIA